MAVERSSRQHRTWQVLPLPLIAVLAYLAFATPSNADETAENSSTSPIERRIDSLFRASYVQPEDDVNPEDPGLSALSELESLLSEPVLVPGSSAVTLTELADELPLGLPPGYAVPPIGRRTPAAVTRMDFEMIWSSGARRLTELFDIYVPNTQITKHHFSFEHVITRGLLGDLEDKYLFLVNGKIMNHQTITGSFSEVRDLPLLGDIHHVDFVRGPGSALWGPGAISGVISLVTHSAMTFQGTDATIRQGAFETFTTAEVRHGRKFTHDSGIFAYFGIADYSGANYSNAPLYFSSSFPTPDSMPDVIAGQPVAVPGAYPNDHQALRDQAKMKLHVQYTKGNFDMWVRYTKGGEKATPQRGEFASPPFGDRPADFDFNTVAPFEFGYMQLTVFGRYLWEINDNLSADLRMSYDTMDFFRYNGNTASPNNPQREEEFYGRAVLNWTPNEAHSLSGGVEMSRNHLGLTTWTFPNAPANTIINGTNGIPWWTTAYSLLGEYQWQPNDCWTFFLTGRWDNHTYTETLFSPRAAIVWTPDEVNTLKFIATESVRRLPEDVLYGDARNNLTTDVESIESLELRYERRPSEPWVLALTGFYQSSEFVGLSGRGNSNQGQFADVDTWGTELEISYRTDRTRIIASQSYTGLINFDLVGPFALPDPFDISDPDYFFQQISAAPYGFGNELANQSPHLTKIAVHHEHDCHWSSDASLRIYWGRPGDQDFNAFENARLAAMGSANRVSDPGFTKSYRESIFLNYAINYRHNDCVTARLDLYNILGWFDKDISKRNFILEGIGTYRAEAPAIAATVRVKY